MAEELAQLLEERFKQGQIYSREADYQVFVNKGSQVKILEKPPTRQAADLSHNRRKNYLLSDNEPNEFLIRLGVMNAKGKVLAPKYDKFRQINRFLEMVDDVADELDQGRPLTIIDFGCGKSYLTFALYHYLHEHRGLAVKIVGLDLKEDVVCHCNELARDLNYDQLSFLVGDIKDYTGLDRVDMVVTLHACDTATDAALAKAVQWNAKVILSVPCCQHEINKQLRSELMRPMEKHGILKERLSALVTDSLRGNVLEIMGYNVQMLEFIDMEHTPKNLLIRAVQKPQPEPSAKVVEEYLHFRDFWHLTPYIEEAFGEPLRVRLGEAKRPSH
ncbi:MAG: class I SAM-dependent methyltransferase [Bacillota bacterium]